VRDFPDLDETDLPNSVLDVWAREGATRIAVAEDWSFYAVDWTLAVSSGDATYDYSAITSGGYTIATITDVIGESYRLRPAPHADARRWFINETSGEPRVWSTRGNTLYLWPIPDAAYTLNIVGYRAQKDWVADGSGAVPDLPAELHELVATWCLSRAYAQQDDLEASEQQMSRFNDQFRATRAQFLEDIAGPAILNGGRITYDQTSALPTGARFDWE
jgi:hypothetical protein